MSYSRERIQGAGAIAAAAPAPRSAPAPMVRMRSARRALGDIPNQACRLTASTARMPDGSVVVVNYRSIASMPWCPGASPSAGGSAFVGTVRAQSRLQAAQLTAVSLGPAPVQTSATPVIGTAVAPPSPPKPASTTTDPAATRGPIAPAPSSSSSSTPSRSSTSITTTTTNNYTSPAAPSQLPPVDLSLLTSSPSRKVPWLAIGAVVLGAALLLRK